MAYRFPGGFLWGTATAAHQVEGNNVNSDFWVMEHQEGTIFAEPSGDAVDQIRLYRDDLDLLKSLGFAAYRFSIEWARVEPEPGFFSKAAIEHYRSVATYAHSIGLKTCATLHHFTNPRWVTADGGWIDMKTADRFARYCDYVVRELGPHLDMICTINEANLTAVTQLGGRFFSPETFWDAPWFTRSAGLCGASDPKRFAPYLLCEGPKTIPVLIGAHRKAYDAIKAHYDGPVGVTLALQDQQALPGGEAARDDYRAACDDQFLEAIRGDDFVGVQSYTRIRFGPEGRLKTPKDAERTQMGYEFYPDAIGGTVRYAAAVSGCPVYVTENGIGTEDDTRRIAYYAGALKAVAGCIDEGIDVRGYFAWSLLDNYEWMLGYRPKFGLVAVDRETQERSVKPSGTWLGGIARANALPDA